MQHVITEAEGLLSLLVQDLVKQLQPLPALQWPPCRAHGLQVIEDFRLDPLQGGLGLLQIGGLHPEGDVLLSDPAVVSLGHLLLQHPVILPADLVEFIVSLIDPDGRLHLGDPGLLADAAHLQADAGVKVVVEVAPVVEGCGLVLVLGQLVVDVPEFDALGVEPVRHPADPVPVHLPIRDRLLSRTWRRLFGGLFLLPGLGFRRFTPFSCSSFLSRGLFCPWRFVLLQWAFPPFP